MVARPKSTNRSVQTAVRLPEALHQRLSQAGRGSLSNEIKRRLEATLDWENVDPPTRDLIAVIVEMAALIRDDAGQDWHSSEALKGALANAVAGWLREYVSENSSTTARQMRGESALWLRDGDSPEQAGLNLLRLYKLVSAKNAASGGSPPLLKLNALAFWNLKPEQREQVLQTFTSDIGLGISPSKGKASKAEKSKGAK